ncbi:hypothetical protein [Enterovibrio norvegicus]|uniref:hypothetical protein n=1 Tax=Enterovibrio norvegicus TaxID=188144 RepID=UPI000C84DFC6|nr:hypothetical protein [Enterovibrio norvegicus]MCC4796977.1 hypothetical protein [Enterovibrio norvegicus]PMI40713.1 hypothetical protein BCU46_04750 [Enterovibrio norvegicus]
MPIVMTTKANALPYVATAYGMTHVSMMVPDVPLAEFDKALAELGYIRVTESEAGELIKNGAHLNASQVQADIFVRKGE